MRVMNFLSPGNKLLRASCRGLDVIITRIEIDYKYPLRSRDLFVVRLNLRREGNIRVVFDQHIFRLPDEKPIVKASVVAVATKTASRLLQEI